MAHVQDHSDLEVANARGGDLEVAWGDSRPYLHRLSISRFGSRSHFHETNRSRLRGGGDKVPTLSPSDAASPAPTYTTARLGAVDGESYDEKTAFAGHWGAAAPDRERRYTPLGLTRPVFLAILIGGAVFLLGIGATIVGVVISKRNAGGGGDVQPPPGSLTNVAATNFTDGRGLDRKVVVYQDTVGSLMAALWDQLSNQWSTQNITASIINSTHVSGLDVKRGTPLAVATNGVQISLYYLNSLNRVAELWSPVKDQWLVGQLTSLNLQASPKSRLAATWQVCGNGPYCPGSLLVFYEDMAGLVQLANMTTRTGGTWQLMPPISPVTTVAGSGLSINLFVDSGHKVLAGTQPTALRLYRIVGTSLFELINGPLTHWTWALGNYGASLDSAVPTNPAPQIASLTYSVDPANGWDHNLVMTLSTSGVIMAHTWNGTVWTTKGGTLMAGPRAAANLTSFAVTQGLCMYGVANGGIWEYQVKPQTYPWGWTYVSQVSTPGGLL